MSGYRYFISVALSILAVCAVAVASQTPKPIVSAKKKNLPTLSAQQVFKRVSPSVMVVESLDAKGKVTTLGSGVVIAPGRVITNRHVIEDGVSFRVVHNNKKWPAKLIKVDPDHDLAELSVAGLNAPAVTVLDSSKLAVGETVYAVGAPEGLELTISEGLISGLRDFDKGRVIQTSAAISPGSSGGGLFDAQGRLVGITTFYLKEGQSLNFALPAEWTLALDREPTIVGPAVAQDSSTFQALLWLEVGLKSAEVAVKAAEAGHHDTAMRSFATAVHALEEFARLEPGQEQAWSILGMAYNTTGRYDDALRAYRKALRLRSEDEDAWIGLGDAYSNLGQHDDARDAYQGALKLKPGDESAWCRLGVAYGAIGEYDKEVSAEREAIRLKPDYEVAWYDLGVAYGAFGQYSEAISAEREAIRLEPDDPNAWYELGLVFNARGQQSEVLKIYERLKALSPKLADKFFDAAVVP